MVALLFFAAARAFEDVGAQGALSRPALQIGSSPGHIFAVWLMETCRDWSSCEDVTRRWKGGELNR